MVVVQACVCIFGLCFLVFVCVRMCVRCVVINFQANLNTSSVFFLFLSSPCTSCLLCILSSFSNKFPHVPLCCFSQCFSSIRTLFRFVDLRKPRRPKKVMHGMNKKPQTSKNNFSKTTFLLSHKLILSIVLL